MIKNTIIHTRRILRHRHYALKYCAKAGILWQGLMHDLSKFSYAEFTESVKYFNPSMSPVRTARHENGYSIAYLHHIHRNKHHYEYWQHNYDLGVQPIQMPYRYALEMLCDYLSAGRVYYGKDFSYEKEYQEFWLNKNTYNMHPQTRNFINNMLLEMSKSNSDDALKNASMFYQNAIPDNLEIEQSKQEINRMMQLIYTIRNKESSIKNYRLQSDIQEIMPELRRCITLLNK